MNAASPTALAGPAASSALSTPDRRGRVLRALDELALAGGTAVVAALLQMAVVRLFPIPFSVYEWDYRSAPLIWKTPWGYLLAFSPMALLLAAIALVRPSVLSLRASLTVWCTLALWGVAVMFTEIHGVASLLLALGLAMPVASFLAVRWGPSQGRLRAVSLALVALALLARPAFDAWRSSTERATLAALPAAPSGAPNVIFLIWDTVRAGSLSLYGAAVPTTPVLDSLARSAVTFDQAFATAPWTLPSHGSMFTGRYASATRTEFAVPLADDAPTLAEALRHRGWATGGFTANIGATREASGLAQGFVHYSDFASSFYEILRSTPLVQADFFLVLLENIRTRRFYRIWPEVKQLRFGNNFTAVSHDHKKAPEIAADFLAWQGALPPGRPFFAFLNFWDAHAPYVAPAEYLRAVSDASNKRLDRYHAAIRFVDHELGVMLGELERRRVLDNTIVVITSDHGEQFGEHGLTLHSNSLYRQLLHVPLMIRYPRETSAGMRIAAPVSLRDLPATALDLLGIPQDSTELEGRSLAPFWRGGAPTASEVLSELSRHYRTGSGRFRNANGPMASLVADSLHIIRDGNDKLEVYDLARDLPQERNLAIGPLADSFGAQLKGAIERNVPKREGLYAPGAGGPPRRPKRAEKKEERETE
jgi:arylsulfatase A-like enzyme